MEVERHFVKVRKVKDPEVGMIERHVRGVLLNRWRAVVFRYVMYSLVLADE